MRNDYPPFFSVVIPTYNRAEKVKTAVQSVLEQTDGDFEILVMDDGSRDNTANAIKLIGDSRITYEWAINSGGPATPRNRGLRRARGQWITFLDADDIWYPQRLETVRRAIEANPGAEAVCHAELLSTLSTGEKSELRHGPYEDDFYRVLLTTGNRISTSATTIRTNFLRQHKIEFNESPDYVIIEDYDLWMKVILFGGRFLFLADILGEYIVENDNISSNLTRHRKNLRAMLHDHVFKIQNFEADREKLWRKVETRLLLHEVRDHVQERKFSEGVATLLRTLFERPLITIGILAEKLEKKWGAT